MIQRRLNITILSLWWIAGLLKRVNVEMTGSAMSHCRNNFHSPQPLVFPHMHMHPAVRCLTAHNWKSHRGWKCYVIEIYTQQTWNHEEHYCNLAGRQTDVLGGVALHSEDFISSLRRNHIGLLGLSIPSAEAWRPKKQFPVELGHHCQTVPATPWQTY